MLNFLLFELWTLTKINLIKIFRVYFLFWASNVYSARKKTANWNLFRARIQVLVDSNDYIRLSSDTTLHKSIHQRPWSFVTITPNRLRNPSMLAYIFSRGVLKKSLRTIICKLPRAQPTDKEPLRESYVIRPRIILRDAIVKDTGVVYVVAEMRDVEPKDAASAAAAAGWGKRMRRSVGKEGGGEAGALLASLPRGGENARKKCSNVRRRAGGRLLPLHEYEWDGEEDDGGERERGPWAEAAEGRRRRRTFAWERSRV